MSFIALDISERSLCGLQSGVVKSSAVLSAVKGSDPSKRHWGQLVDELGVDSLLPEDA